MDCNNDFCRYYDEDYNENCRELIIVEHCICYNKFNKKNKIKNKIKEKYYYNPCIDCRHVNCIENRCHYFQIMQTNIELSRMFNQNNEKLKAGKKQ